jgi:1-acyl-sn-glycerol-3-phosphate acyltransferase
VTAPWWARPTAAVLFGGIWPTRVHGADAVPDRGGVLTRGRGDVGAVRLGVAWPALSSGAPVVPVACLGTRRTGQSTHRVPRPRTRLDVVFGEALVLDADRGVPGRLALARAGERVRDRMAGHVRRAVELTGQTLPADLGWSAEEILRGEHL